MLKRSVLTQKLYLFIVIPLISFSASSVLFAANQSINRNAALCQEVQKRIETVTRNVTSIYDDNTEVYVNFSNLLAIDKEPEGSRGIQARLKNINSIVQKNQIELMNLYSLICSDKQEEVVVDFNSLQPAQHPITS